MQVTIVRDGRTAVVEVADDLASATVAGRSYPVAVVSRSATRVEVEVAGERVVVENWPEHFPAPPGPVDVNGERWSVGVERGPGVEPATVRKAPRVPVPTASSHPGPTASSGPAPPGEGVAVVPPMPGKVIEVRVRDGDRVRRGDVLLVLEAMKMRNEVTSPTDGTVEGLRVSVGSNARAREPMLFVSHLS
jgi:glutaconyl-CoA/methylmalonyl-CoA decarboxylase subunit gamma